MVFQQKRYARLRLQNIGAKRSGLFCRCATRFCNLRLLLRSCSAISRFALRSFFRLPLTVSLRSSDFLARCTPFSAPLTLRSNALVLYRFISYRAYSIGASDVTHKCVVVRLYVCRLSHSWTLPKPFDRMRCHLAGIQGPRSPMGRRDHNGGSQQCRLSPNYFGLVSLYIPASTES